MWTADRSYSPREPTLSSWTKCRGLAAQGPSRELHVKCLEALVMRLQKSEFGELGIDGLLLVR